jgi:hypothetical protein
MAEQRFLLLAGLAVGTLASALAVAPTALLSRTSIPFGLLAAFLIGTAVLSLGWIRLAAGAALRAPLIPALRQE